MIHKEKENNFNQIFIRQGNLEMGLEWGNIMQHATIFIINNTLGCFRVFVYRNWFIECEIYKRSEKAMIKVTRLRNWKLFEHILCTDHLTISCLQMQERKQRNLVACLRTKLRNCRSEDWSPQWFFLSIMFSCYFGCFTWLLLFLSYSLIGHWFYL